MKFSEIIGNNELKQSLARMVDQGRLSHAIILCENEPSGALSLAVALAQYVNCRNHIEGDSCSECNSCHKYGKLIHPDLHFVFPVNSSKLLNESQKKAPISDYFLQQFRQILLDNPLFSEQQWYDKIELESKMGNIGVAESKRILEKLSLYAAEGDYKTMIIWLPERMNAECANKLLKILEEPSAGTLFILVSQAPEKLLPTIVSRCQMIRLAPLSPQEKKLLAGGMSTPEEYFGILEQLFEYASAGSLADLFSVWEALADLKKPVQREFCLYAEQFVRKLYLAACGTPDLSQIAPFEEQLAASLIPRLKVDFYEKIFNALENAISAIESNVSSKLIFCDLANRFYIYSR